MLCKVITALETFQPISGLISYGGMSGNGNGYLMQKIQFGGCHMVGRSILKGVSLCTAALLILKIVGMSTCISNPEKEAGHIHAKYVCLGVLTTM